MKYLLILITALPLLSTAQIRFEGGTYNYVGHFVDAWPIIVKKDHKSTIVAVFSYGDKDVIKFLETTESKYVAQEIAEYTLGIGTIFMQWELVDNKLLLVYGDDVEDKKGAANKKTYMLLLDHSGKELARRTVGPYLGYNYTICF